MVRKKKSRGGNQAARNSAPSASTSTSAPAHQHVPTPEEERRFKAVPAATLSRATRRQLLAGPPPVELRGLRGSARRLEGRRGYAVGFVQEPRNVSARIKAGLGEPDNGAPEVFFAPPAAAVPIREAAEAPPLEDEPCFAALVTALRDAVTWEATHPWDCHVAVNPDNDDHLEVVGDDATHELAVLESGSMNVGRLKEEHKLSLDPTKHPAHHRRSWNGRARRCASATFMTTCHASASLSARFSR